MIRLKRRAQSRLYDVRKALDNGPSGHRKASPIASGFRYWDKQSQCRKIEEFERLRKHIAVAQERHSKALAAIDGRCTRSKPSASVHKANRRAALVSKLIWKLQVLGDEIAAKY